MNQAEREAVALAEVAVELKELADTGWYEVFIPLDLRVAMLAKTLGRVIGAAREGDEARMGGHLAYLAAMAVQWRAALEGKEQADGATWANEPAGAGGAD